jgi:hypothetical protein
MVNELSLLLRLFTNAPTRKSAAKYTNGQARRAARMPSNFESLEAPSFALTLALLEVGSRVWCLAQH